MLVLKAVTFADYLCSVFIQATLVVFHRRSASEGIVSLGVCVSVCVSAALHVGSVRWAVAACCFSLGSEGNALYPVLSS